MDTKETPETIINYAKVEPTLSQPDADVTTSEPDRIAVKEFPVAASGVELHPEEKKLGTSTAATHAAAEAFGVTATLDTPEKRAAILDRRVFPTGFDSVLTPLQPQPEMLTIRADFAISTFDKDLKISPRDFQFYDLSAEVSGLPKGEFHVLRHTFQDDLCVTCYEVPQITSHEVRQVDCPGSDRTKFLHLTKIEFAERPLIVKASATVRVIVRSFEGAVLWSKECKADPLDNLYIEVTHQKPIILFKRKKLRGQVLELGKKCKLKDLTVVIQAKAQGDSLWRSVGVGTTDSAGNFSVPYPFGAFVEAQALVSATPNSPAPIKVTNQTIAEDFLYLLLKDIECPPTEAEEDCDCNGKKRPSRLPDQADLIVFDEYTQDIGGSCVNLSTPNRTLNEFHYQAIVRTFDPEVANYTLEKVKKLKPVGVDPVRMLEISRALSALDSGLRDLTLQNALSPAASSAARGQLFAARAHIEKVPNPDVAAAIKSVDLLISDLSDVIQKAAEASATGAITPLGPPPEKTPPAEETPPPKEKPPPEEKKPRPRGSSEP
jgi:hypothetical protein